MGNDDFDIHRNHEIDNRINIIHNYENEEDEVNSDNPNNPIIFIAFKSINNITYIIYTNAINDIISYNLINNQKINIIKKAHEKEITKLKYYLDDSNERELIMSISQINNNIKIWDFNNWQCIHNYNKINLSGSLISSSFLKVNKETYIITSNFSKKCSESLKIYDLKGEKIDEIYDSDEETFFFFFYYEDYKNKIYLLVGNLRYVKSYDYYNNKLYYQYSDKQNCGSAHTNMIIIKKEENIILIESSLSYIRIWNFHTGKLLNRICSDKSINSIFLWDNNFLFVGCDKGIIRLVELSENKFIEELQIINNEDINVNVVQSMTIFQKINHPQYGECLMCKVITNKNINIIIKKKESNSFNLFKEISLN